MTVRPVRNVSVPPVMSRNSAIDAAAVKIFPRRRSAAMPTRELIIIKPNALEPPPGARIKSDYRMAAHFMS